MTRTTFTTPDVENLIDRALAAIDDDVQAAMVYALAARSAADLMQMEQDADFLRFLQEQEDGYTPAISYDDVF